MTKPDDDWKAESEARFWMEYDHIIRLICC